MVSTKDYLFLGREFQSCKIWDYYCTGAGLPGHMNIKLNHLFWYKQNPSEGRPRPHGAKTYMRRSTLGFLTKESMHGMEFKFTYIWLIFMVKENYVTSCWSPSLLNTIPKTNSDSWPIHEWLDVLSRYRIPSPMTHPRDWYVSLHLP